MKYGLIVYSELPKGRNKDTEDLGLFNVGDNVQMYCMRRLLLEELKVKKEDIVEIDFHDLATYKGEYLIVPINLFFMGCHDSKETWFPASSYIIPVFTGVHFSSGNLTEEEVRYLTFYAPIGCRDEWTLSTMRRYNIPAYLAACVTATLPRRNSTPSNGATYFVDVDVEKLSQVMPAKYLEKTKEVHHVEQGRFSLEMFEKMDNLAESYINEYRDNAALVVTSRLHCASPCIAMGIPTVMVVKEKSIRYAWLEKLLPIYTEDEIGKIDWNIEALNYEDMKAKMIELIKFRLLEAKSKYEQMYEISSFFEDKNRVGFKRPYEKIFDTFKELMKEEFSGIYFWGGTVLAEDLYACMKHDLKLSATPTLIDEFNFVDFHGRKSVKFEAVKDEIKDGALIVATATSAQQAIIDAIRSTGKKSHILTADGNVVKL